MILAITIKGLGVVLGSCEDRYERTVKSDNTEDEDQRENQNNNGVDLQTGRLVSVESCVAC